MTLFSSLTAPLRRRSFLKYAGASASAAGLALAGCNSSDAAPQTVAVGLGDGGVLNYVYAIEQLSAAFYGRVRTGAYYLTLLAASAERSIWDDLFYHETIHRDFLRTAIVNANVTPIKALTFNFSGVNFSDRNSVLGTARLLKDLSVAAYNGVGSRLSSPALLYVAGKIVSVEARHAAIIRDLQTESTFVGNDIVTLTEGTSLERARLPTDVATVLSDYLADGSKLDVSGLSM